MAKSPGNTKTYIPERGDVIWIDLDPSAGSEIKKTRPALVISPSNYNAKVGLALLCPITSHKKGYPFEVELPSKGSIGGVILSDQIKSLDWGARHAKFEEKVSPQLIAAVIEKVLMLVKM
ncbi:MAG TPA: endoribonuclease MazF [Bdellovibrionota bacterium]|nr:endoribonuclease MazF [Bdellovibrionota bacterium]